MNLVLAEKLSLYVYSADEATARIIRVRISCLGDRGVMSGLALFVSSVAIVMVDTKLNLYICLC